MNKIARDLMKSGDRIISLDLLRGLIIVIMALDHTRGFFFGINIDPTDLNQTNSALFLTRWISHFCAPGFLLLAGISAFLFGQRKGNIKLKTFLWRRGLILILLELTIINFAWIPEPFYKYIIFQIIWVIGWSMLLLSPFVELPPLNLTIGGVIIILSHNLLSFIDVRNFKSMTWGFIWSILHEQHNFEPSQGPLLMVVNPLIPWIAVMALGFGLGQIFLQAPKTRIRLLRWIGYSLIVSFIVIRAINLYGNPTPWGIQEQPLYTIFSFLNCEKNPPSLSFLLMTLGPLILLLSFFESSNLSNWLEQRLVILGRVPLFFYIIHLYLLRFVSLVAAYARWGKDAFLAAPEGHSGCPEYPLYASYIICLIAIMILYPLCQKYIIFKHQKRTKFAWVKYF